MAHSDNFKLVVEAIEAERINADSSDIIELRQTKANKLNTIPANDIINILRDLEAGYKVIKIVKENRPSSKSKDVATISEYKLRDVANELDWQKQLEMWKISNEL